MEQGHEPRPLRPRLIAAAKPPRASQQSGRAERGSAREEPSARLRRRARKRSKEDFTEFEQRAAYFDGDPVIAKKKGVNVLERASQVHFMAEFMALLDFPPAPKLNLYGGLDRAKATPAELRGEGIFNGKAQCSFCHPAPYYTDNLMHDLGDAPASF